MKEKIEKQLTKTLTQLSETVISFGETLENHGVLLDDLSEFTSRASARILELGQNDMDIKRVLTDHKESIKLLSMKVMQLDKDATPETRIH